MPTPPPGKILNPATGKHVNIDGAVGLQVQMTSNNYHTFYYNFDISTECGHYVVPMVKSMNTLLKQSKRFAKCLNGIYPEAWARQ